MVHLTPHPSHKGRTLPPSMFDAGLGTELQCVAGSSEARNTAQHMGIISGGKNDLWPKKHMYKTHGRLARNWFTTLASHIFADLKNFSHDKCKSVSVVLRLTPFIVVERNEQNVLKYYKGRYLILLCWCFPTASLQLTNHAVVMSYFFDLCWFCCSNIKMNVAPGSWCQVNTQQLKSVLSKLLWLRLLIIGCSLIIIHQVHLLCSISFQFSFPVWLGLGK